MKRQAHISRIRPEKLNEYIELHANPWPGVLKAISESHIENYSIFHQPMPSGEHLLFSYFEYTGTNIEADMAKMAANKTIQQWWDVCKPCLEPITPLPEGEVWNPITSIFFQA